MAENTFFGVTNEKKLIKTKTDGMLVSAVAHSYTGVEMDATLCRFQVNARLIVCRCEYKHCLDWGFGVVLNARIWNFSFNTLNHPLHFISILKYL